MIQTDPFGLNFGLGILGGLAQNFNNNNSFGAFNAPKEGFGMPPTTARTHLGMASCELLKKYTSSYPCLK